MRWSKCFIPTLRESPASAETVAEKLLVRAGFMRAVSTGVYGFPKARAAEIAVDVMRHHESQFARIVACVFDAETEALYRRLV